MAFSNECPHCTYPLLRHVREGNLYWYCRRCRREVPYAIAKPIPQEPATKRVAIDSAQNGKHSQVAILSPSDPASQTPANQMEPSQNQVESQHSESFEREQFIEEFLGTVSHEMRTPLTIMRMALRLAESTLSQQGVLPANASPANPLNKLPQYFTTLKQECDREIKLINDLLLLQEMEMTSLPVAQVQLTVPIWLPNVVTPFLERSRQNQQHIQLNLPSDLPTLTTDPELLERILTELLDNALKFTPTNGVITLAVSIAAGSLQLKVSNTGIAIPPDQINRVFDKFYRIPSQDPNRHGGTGLGLALAKKLADTLGIALLAESYPDQTCFVLEIPCPDTPISSKSDLLMSYVAYYLSRGKTILTPHQHAIAFDGLVYEYWGYHRDFLHFWHRLQQRSDFQSLLMEGDMHSFGEFLAGRCHVLECARCSLPRTLPSDHHNSPNHCPCDRPAFTSLHHLVDELDEIDQIISSMHVVVVGMPSQQSESFANWFAINGFNATFVSRPSAIAINTIPTPVNLVVIDASLSRTEAETWARQLHAIPELQRVPIIALSPKYLSSNPWSDRKLDVSDYLLTPLSGKTLANHLQKQMQSQTDPSAVELLWFPR